MSNKVIVIGGGASGMMAGISASQAGGQVIIIERNNRIGRKILATGNGRCNYTNINLSVDNYHGRNPKFTYSALSKFDVKQTIDYFERIGITPYIEKDGRVFPMSLQSSSVLDVLRHEIEDLGIQLMLESYVKSIRKEKRFIVELNNGKRIEGDKVILATGGKSMPNSGSDGNGYDLARGFGHNIIDSFPGLVQLHLEGDIFKKVSGVKFPGIAQLVFKDKILIEDSGDILFTNYGISGPPILQISRTALDYLRRNKDVELKISIIHTMSEEELIQYLEERFIFMPRKSVEESLIGLINKRLINPILKEINIDKGKNVANISKEEILSLAKILKSWKFKITGSQGWHQAQVTAGGVDTKEVNNRTFESKLVEGLYIVGELLDIDGDCGGFNLQWAWSSGYIAGLNSVKLGKVLTNRG